MGPADPRQAARQFQEVTEALRDALDRDDGDAVRRLLEQREHHLAQLAEALADAGPSEACLGPLLDELRRIDAESLALARERLGATREELEQVRRARGLARSLTADDAPARFVDERV